MNDGRYNYFSLNGPNIVMNKPRYREEEFRKKNTYNLVTDPRIKRGRNYGIVYVTSTAFDENDIAMKKLNSGISSETHTNENNLTSGSNLTHTKKSKKGINKAENLEAMGVPLPPHLESVGSMTTEIKEILPTPETFDMEVQTQDYIDLPQIPLFKPEKRGEDAGTQIEKGELFDFNVEVEPIINVLTFKTLEEARMEVLEEEEIKEMKRQMQDFEKVRNRELEIVQKLECQTIRKDEEKNRRNQERVIRTKMAKIYQKKLISSVFAKNYLKNMKSKVLKDLEENGVLRKKEKNEYHTKIVPAIKEGCEKLLQEENSVLFGLDNLLENGYNDMIRNKHKEALENETKRKAEEKRKKIEELIRQRDEKIRRRIERQRRKHEKEMEELRVQIKEELISKGEFIDTCSEIYNMNFYGQKDYRGVPTVLGHAGQLCIILTLLKNSFIKIFTETSEEMLTDKEKEKPPDVIEEKKSPEKEKKSGGSQLESQQIVEPLFLDFDETVKKLIDLYLLKSYPFYFVLPNDIFEQIKALNENIASIDDIWKLDNDETFQKISSLIIQTNLQSSADPVFEMVSQILIQHIESVNFNTLYVSILSLIFNICKTTSEFDPKEKIKFILVQALPTDDGNYFGICDLKQPSVSKTKSPNELAAQLLAKKNLGKKDAKGRPYFDPTFNEKVFIAPLISPKMKILALSSNYEKMLRNNFLTCLQRSEIKFMNEAENLFNTLDREYNQFLEEFKQKLQDKYSKDVLDIVIDVPAET